MLGLTVIAGNSLADARTGKNGRHALVGLLRQSVFSRLAGYEDVNDAERLRHDPAMRWIVGGKASHSCAASPSQLGRFETQWLAADKNLLALADLSGQWIDRVHTRRPPRGIVLDMDSSVSPNSRRTREQRLERQREGHTPCKRLAARSCVAGDAVGGAGEIFAPHHQIGSRPRCCSR